MNKKVGVLFAVLLTLSVFQVALVLAESGSGSSGDSGSGSTTSGSGSTGLDGENEDETEVNVEDDGSVKIEQKTRVGNVKREIKREIRNGEVREEIRIRNADGSEVRQEIRIKSDGERIIEFKQKIKERNGTFEFESENEEKVKVRISELNDTQKAIIAGRINAKTGLNLTAEDIGNGTRGEILRAYLSNGRYADIKVMPDRAAAVAISKMKVKCEERNCSVELREVGSGNKSEVRYIIETNKSARTFGIFKSKMKVQAHVNPETGELILTKKPWWAFLANEDDESEVEVEGNATVEANVTVDINESAAGSTMPVLNERNDTETIVVNDSELAAI